MPARTLTRSTLRRGVSRPGGALAKIISELFPFLPGDTLLFTAGLIAAQPDAPVDVWTLAPCAAVAAVAGGQLGYLIGWRLGPALFKKEEARFFKKHYLESSHAFFSKHGRKTIVIGHFVGVARTFTPVIAGASGMRYPVFLAYDIVGATLWGAGLTLVGYHLGGVWFVNEHLEWMVLAIAVLSTPRSSGRCWARRPSVDGPSPRTAPISQSPEGR